MYLGRLSFVCAVLLAVGGELSSASAQDSNTATPFGSETSLPPVNSNDATSDEQQNKSNATTNDQMPQFQTSAQEAENAGLVPTVGETGALGAAGFAPTTPGLTSFGGQAASAAAATRQFLTLSATQSIAYSDNPGQFVAPQVSSTAFSSQLAAFDRPDFYETSSGSILVSKDFGRQNFFFAGSISDVEYFQDKNFDTTRYSVSVGDDYAIGDTCAGSIVANQSQSQVPLELSVASLGPQNTQNSSIEVNTRCRVTGYLSTTSDFRLAKTSFSAGSSNNSNQLFGSGGLEYAVPSFVTMGILSSIQETTFSDRGALGLSGLGLASSGLSLTGLPLTNFGLANQTSQLSFSLYANKPLSRKLNVALSAGIVDLATGSPTFAGQIQPIYTAALTYAYSPKTSFGLSYNHLVGSPQNTTLANFQQIETISASVSYRFSPRISISLNASRSSNSSSDLGVTPGNAALTAAFNTTSLTEQATARYALSPAASVALAYQHIDQTQESFGSSKANVVSLTVDYRR